MFCGWICPFGTLHHFFGWIFPSRYGRGSSRVEANKTHALPAREVLPDVRVPRSRRSRAARSAASSIRSASRSAPSASRVIPAVQYIGASRRSARAQDVHGAPRPGRRRQHAGRPRAARSGRRKQFYFHQTWFIVVLLIAILFMNRFIPRFWCRVLCPLGAFLGVFARFALFGMEKDHAKCTDCNLCLVNCQGADSPAGRREVAAGRVPHVPELRDGLPRGRHQVPLPAEPQERASARPTPGGARALATAAAGAAFIPVARIADSLDANYDSKVIRPPGAVEERAFLERCIRCAECMKVCPNNALHPAFFEAGIEGMWTPILIARIGYCEHSCVLCGQVCPTGAIQKITEKEKLGIGVPPIKIGTAFYDHGRCLPVGMQTPCIVCEEFCPTSPKAIWVEEVDAPMRDSQAGPERRAAGDEDGASCSARTSIRRSASAAARARRSARCRTARRLRHQRRRDPLEDERHPAREHELQLARLTTGGLNLLGNLGSGICARRSSAP